MLKKIVYVRDNMLLFVQFGVVVVILVFCVNLFSP